MCFAINSKSFESRLQNSFQQAISCPLLSLFRSALLADAFISFHLLFLWEYSRYSLNEYLSITIFRFAFTGGGGIIGKFDL